MFHYILNLLNILVLNLAILIQFKINYEENQSFNYLSVYSPNQN